MFKEIGSNFFLDPEEFEKYRYSNKQRDFMGSDKKSVYSSSGRGAISLVLDQLDKKDKVALLPIYTCDSVVSPFIRKGYKVEFYDVEIGLTLDWAKVEESISLYHPDLILFHSYFGFDSLGAIREHTESIRSRGITIIEDITHSLFSGSGKIEADYQIASLRKWIGIPDGGLANALYNDFKLPHSKHQKEMAALSLEALHEKYRYTQNMRGDSKKKYRTSISESEKMLDDDNEFYFMSEASKMIICNTDFEYIKTIRRANYEYMLSEIKQIDFLTPVFPELPQSVVPLFLPVYVGADRSKLRNYFIENEVYMPVHWGVPEFFEDRLTGNAKYICNHILSIPIDQRYSIVEMKRIADLLKAYNKDVPMNGQIIKKILNT